MTDKTTNERLAEIIAAISARHQDQKKAGKMLEREKYPTFAHYTKEYIDAMVPGGASERRIEVTTHAFRSGLLVGFETLRHAFDPLQKMREDGKQETEEYKALDIKLVEYIISLEKEVADFARELAIEHLAHKIAEARRSKGEIHVMEIKSFDDLARVLADVMGIEEDDDGDGRHGDDTNANRDQHEHRKHTE